MVKRRERTRETQTAGEMNVSSGVVLLSVCLSDGICMCVHLFVLCREFRRLPFRSFSIFLLGFRMDGYSFRANLLMGHLLTISFRWV